MDITVLNCVSKQIIKKSIMSNIFINGSKSKIAGGKSILNNYLTLLKRSNSKNKFIVLTPDKNEYNKYSSNFIKIINIKDIYKKNILFPFLNYFVIPKLLKDYNIDSILNLGTIAIPTSIPQLYLFDWPYAVYPNSIVWKRMDIKDYLSRKIKLFVFKKHIKYATTVIAQTKTIKDKLKSIYGLNNIEIIPNAISLENMSNNKFFNFNLQKNKIKLLYLTYYYSHKNLEIFIPLAKKIKKRKLNFQIITTIDESQHLNAKIFLSNIKKFKLENVIHNIGPVDMKYVPALYQQVDGLLMPTLLESFSGTYVEAMFHKIPIFTSDMDFAKDVCGKAAFYFNPLNVNSILSSINLAFEKTDIKILKIKEGNKRLNQLLSWRQVFEKYQELLEKNIGELKR